MLCLAETRGSVPRAPALNGTMAESVLARMCGGPKEDTTEYYSVRSTYQMRAHDGGRGGVLSRKATPGAPSETCLTARPLHN